MSESKADMLRLKIDVLRRRRDDIAASSPNRSDFGLTRGGRSGWESSVRQNASMRDWRSRLKGAQAELDAAEAEALK